MSFQPPPTSATYPYGSYPSAHYSANLQTWPYYTPAQSTSKPATTTTTTTTTTASTSTQPRAATFSSYTPSTARESVATSSTGRGARKQVNIKGLFTKELKNLMYGFGDDRNPANDTVNVMEEILVEYITDVCQTAGGPSRKMRLSIEDLRKALSRPADAKKLARMEELLFMQEDIKRARAQFEDTDMQHKGF